MLKITKIVLGLFSAVVTAAVIYNFFIVISMRPEPKALWGWSVVTAIVIAGAALIAYLPFTSSKQGS